jgi:putative copper export protein
VNGLLFMAPALVFALALFARHFPGERQLNALVARRRRRLRRAPARMIAAARAPWALVPRGSWLLAGALATRPPPLALQV